MRLKTVAILVGVAFMAALAAAVMAQEAEKAPAHDFIGAKKCIMCHKKDGVGPSWDSTAHATAFDKLTDEQKKDPNFLKYYTTGTDAKGVLLEGVQCEACHGAGSDYKSKSVMSDREAAIKAGMLIPDEKTCLGCHNDKAPAAVAAVAKDWDYAKAKVKGAHAMPVKEESK